MSRRVVLVGGGGHARVVGEAVRAMQDDMTLIGFVDPAPDPDAGLRLGLPHLGDDDAVFGLSDVALVLGVGAVAGVGQRHSIVALLERHDWVTVVHPTAHVSPSARLGRGAVVLPSAVIHAHVDVGDFAVVNSGAVIEHDVEIGTHTMIGPGSVIGGGTTIGTCSYIGLGASVRDNIQVGSNSVVAMGAVVIADVPENSVEYGVRGAPGADRRLR